MNPVLHMRPPGMGGPGAGIQRPLMPPPPMHGQPMGRPGPPAGPGGPSSGRGGPPGGRGGPPPDAHMPPGMRPLPFPPGMAPGMRPPGRAFNSLVELFLQGPCTMVCLVCQIAGLSLLTRIAARGLHRI